MSSPERSSIYVFGDNHQNPRSDVKQRLYSVIPENADLLVMEHAGKCGGEEPSQWIYLKNPSYFLQNLLLAWWQKRKRGASNRLTNGNQTSVAEEVAEEIDLEVEYTDLSYLQRFNQQPTYLTVTSWVAVLLLLLGWVVHPGVSFLSMPLVPAVTLWTHKIHMGMRDEKMAKDLERYATQNSEIIFFAGDDHIGSVGELLEGEVEVVQKRESRL